MLKGGWIIGVVLAVVGLISPCNAQDDTVNISVLYTGDTHGHLESFYYNSDKPVGGVAKRAIYFQEKRRHKTMGWLTLDAGDAISGTALSNVFQGYLDIQAMNRLKYDAMVLGVHEFDYGVDVLQQRMAEAEFPILSANVVYTSTGQPFAAPYTIVERQGVRIAILGLTTSELASRVAAENFTGLSVNDPVETARKYIPELSEQADIIMALTHEGVNDDIRLASQVPELNVIVGGMSESELQVPMKVGNTLIVQDGAYGLNVGLLKLSYAKLAGNKLERKYFDSRLEPMAGLWVENTDYQAWLKSYQTQLIERMGLLVGTAAQTMPSLKVESAETELGNYVCDILQQKTGADAAMLPAAFFANGLDSGPITLGDLYKSMPLNQYAEVLNVSGGELQEILNDAADNIGKPGFPQVSGMSFGIVNGSAYQVKIGGKDLDPFSTYRLATTGAVASGGYGYSTMGTIAKRQYSGRLVRDLVRERLSTGQVASSSLHSRIMFLAQEPASAQTPTSQGSMGQPPAEQPAQTPPEQPAQVAQTPPSQPEQPAEQPSEQPAEQPTEQPAQPPAEQPSEQPSEQPATPPESPSDGNRYDRNGQPLEPTVTIQDQEINDQGSQATPPETPPPAEEQPPAAPSQPATAPSDQTPVIGQAVSNAKGLDYHFTLMPGPEGYQFKLEIGNTGTSPVEMSFDTGERFDFEVYEGDDLQWNFNFNHFFVQVAQTETIYPGDVITYVGDWNGQAKDRSPLAGHNLRMVAVHMLSGEPVRVEFTTTLPKLNPTQPN